ncbi:uncharacterized protein A4U43_C06F50 [Asparagus officinalis]|uniref:Uncharacterized protein n=1 Tax=Asparagus officinalis TaxID=4686 RepID=A0A5P1EMC6_ASPOF|nr:uncharacterized protein LOC109844587 [Asparagus officinalis]ONK65701.1 uncharacterized protein A4U43_C06F50 [Asparagus officinalis]
MVNDGHQLDFCDVFGGPPRSTTNNILLRRHFSGDFGKTAPAPATAAGISSGATNFYDEIFCRHPGSHCRHHCMSDHPNPDSKQGGSRCSSSVRPTAGCSELHSRMRNRRISSSRSSIRGGGRYLPGFNIPSSSCMTRGNTSTPAGAAGLLVQTEEGFYDDIFGSCSNMNGNGGRSSRTCPCLICRSSTKSFKPISKSGSKSKSKASRGSSTISVLSSDQDIELIMPGVYNHHREEEEQDDQDAVLDSFASKLRPITIPRRSRASGYDECDTSAPSTVLVSAGVVRDTKEEDDKDDDVEVSSNRTSTTFMGLSSSACSLLQQPLPSSDHHAKGSPFDANSFPHYYCYHQQRRPGFCPSPDHHQTTIANSKITLISEMYDFAPGSPVSSVVSSLYLEPLPRNAVQAHTQRTTAENKAAAEERGGEIVASIVGDECDKESDRSLSIKVTEDDDEYGGEYSSRRRREMRETEGATAVDEAIAWAKEKFCSGSSAAAAAAAAAGINK